MTVATLGIEVRSEEAARASKDLDLLTGSAKKAEAAAGGLKAANTQAAVGMTAATSAAQHEARALQASAAAARLNAMAMQAQAAASRAAAQNSRMLVFQLNDIAVSLASGMPLWMTLVQQGSQISQLQGGIAGALKETGNMAWRAATRFPLLTAAVAAAGLAFAGLTVEINRTTDVAVGIGDVFWATMSVAKDAIYNLLRPAVAAIAPWFWAAWDSVIASAKWVGNGLINGFRAAFATIRANINLVPDAFIVAGQAAANGFLKGIDMLVNKAMEGFRKIIEGAQQIASMIGGDWLAEKLGWENPNSWLERFKPDGNFTVGRVDIGGADALKRLAEGAKSLAAELQEIGASDPLGDLFTSIRDKAIELARAGEEAGKSLKDAGHEATDAWAGMREVSARAKEEMDAIKQRAEDLKDAWQDFGRGATDLITGLITGTMSWRDALSQAIPLVLQLLANLTKAGLLGGSGGWLASILGMMGYGSGSPASSPTSVSSSMARPSATIPSTIRPPRAISSAAVGFKPNHNDNVRGADNYNVPIQIAIDATGADAAGLARVERQLAQLKAELPGRVVAAVQGARKRNVKV